MRKIRRGRWLIVACVLLIGLILIASLPVFQLKARVRGKLQEYGFLPPPLPQYESENALPERISARRGVVDSLHDALDAKDFEQAAVYNAILAQEAFERSFAVLKAWETMRDPQSGLLPWADGKFFQQWEINTVGANLYSHLLIAGEELDPANAILWEHILAYERDICGSMPCNIDYLAGETSTLALDAGIRAASEYARDGLLAVTETLGEGPWSERMFEIMNLVLDEAPVDTRLGRIPSNSSEVNGSMLQILSRLYWKTGEEKYRQMAERIADIYLFDVMPNNNGFPSDYWDFSAGQPLPEDARFRPEIEVQEDLFPLRLSDHGGEIITGLAEIYYLECKLEAPRCEMYQEPIQNFYDQLLNVGRDLDGLWVSSIVPATLQQLDTNPADAWGYNLAGYQTFDMAGNTNRYAEAIKECMLAVSKTRSLAWEGNRADGYADTVESMLYLLPWFDLPEARYWVDDEIEVMFLKQQDDGFVEKWFLDGNFLRTAQLYARYKTKGIMLAPWSSNLRFGAAYDVENNLLYIHINSGGPWKGMITFDTPRHQWIMSMPEDYPRVNSRPEWFVIKSDASYSLLDGATGELQVYSGEELAEGLMLQIEEAVPYERNYILAELENTEE